MEDFYCHVVLLDPQRTEGFQFKVHRYHRLPPQNCVVWILTACRIQNCFHLLTLADQSAESGPAFSMQRGFTLRLRESHCLDFWSDKGCLTHMSLVVLTECCRSMSSQSGKHSQPASIVSLISLKNSWALLALKICCFFNDTGPFFR